MPYIYLLIAVVSSSSANIFSGFFNRKYGECRGASAVYDFIMIVTILVAWLTIYAFDFSFDVRVLPYSLGVGLCFALSVLSLIYAVEKGPVTLTALVQQFSLIGVALWGFLFWDETISVYSIAGIVTAVCSLFLCIYSGKGKSGQKINAKWFILALLIFIGGAGCSIIQRQQQIVFEGEYGSQLMFFAALVAVLSCIPVLAASDCSEIFLIKKKAYLYPIAAGAGSVLLNLFSILLVSTPLSPSLIYPSIAIGSLLLTMIFSVLFLKEKFRWWQWIGFAAGLAAVFLLSL